MTSAVTARKSGSKKLLNFRLSIPEKEADSFFELLLTSLNFEKIQFIGPSEKKSNPNVAAKQGSQSRRRSTRRPRSRKS